MKSSLQVDRRTRYSYGQWVRVKVAPNKAGLAIRLAFPVFSACDNKTVYYSINSIAVAHILGLHERHETLKWPTKELAMKRVVKRRNTSLPNT